MDTKNTSEIIKLILPIIVLQLGLQIYAIIDLAKRKKTKNLSMGVWFAIIILGELIGSLLYFLIGRSED